MPWVETNSRMIWRGVRIDADRATQLRGVCVAHEKNLEAEFRRLGIGNHRSHSQLIAFFRTQGLLDLFRVAGGWAFSEENLEAFEHHHPTIRLLRAARRVSELRRDRILTGDLVGADGRVHPRYDQLGTHTGRLTSRFPNILGLGGVKRPLVVAGPGRGIGEVDYSQIEMGIAGAVYGDVALIELFNRGDVYTEILRLGFEDWILPADRDLPLAELKRRYRVERDQVKPIALGLLYGRTPHSLALTLEIPLAEATRLRDRILSLFPTLAEGLSSVPVFGGIRGYVSTTTGLRRHRRSPRRQPSGWEARWMLNHPVQGTAAALFKTAGTRLDRLYRKYDAWLIVPLHDSYIFESPLDVYTEVAQLTERVMCEVVQEHFPELDPKVEINTIDPSCWNKAGHSQSLECFLEDPTFSLDGVGPRKRTCSDSDEGPSDINRASRSHLKILDSSV